MAEDKQSILLLATTQTYRLDPFRAAAAKIGVDVVHAWDVPPAHMGAGEVAIGLDFRDPARSVRQVLAYADQRPLAAIIPTDDAAVVLAAHIASALGLPHNSVEAAEATRDKHQMRLRLSEARLASPWFKLFSSQVAPAAVAPDVPYPCVVKPPCLSGSRGVIRADNPAEFVAAFKRVRAILASQAQDEILVEGYIPGVEYALEGLLRAGDLRVLAIFDKPDPLEGPYFEETLYVTPSRSAPEIQTAIMDCAASAARALGLREGALHAEMRVSGDRACLIDIAGRSIGGLCSQTLRFASTADVSLEELILRRALDLELDSMERERRAGGVMMIPIPAAGVFRAVHGIDAARAVSNVEAIEITAQPGYALTPLPEGESYLGFIFARAQTPAEVESALRLAHSRLRFEIEEPLRIVR